LYLSHEKAFREEHNFTDLLEVRHNADDWAKQRFDRLRQLCTTFYNSNNNNNNNNYYYYYYYDLVLFRENKKFKLMLTRRAKAYSSPCSKIALVHLQPFRCNSLLKCAARPKIAKKQQNPLFLEFRAFKSHRC